jgi:hypothetical protein
MAGIEDDMAINPSRGNPVGVHVEAQPFGSAVTGSADTGAAFGGAYVEFDAPSSMLPTSVGPRTTGVIPTSDPLPLQNLNPTFHKVPWYFFGDH